MRSRRSRMLWPVVSVGFAAALGTAILGSTAGREGPRPWSGDRQPGGACASRRDEGRPPGDAPHHQPAQLHVALAGRDAGRADAVHRDSRAVDEPASTAAGCFASGRAAPSGRGGRRRGHPTTTSGCASTATRAAGSTPNAPYYGGLQMDLGFQRAYGAKLLETKGTADNWSPLEQMWVAERAHASGRGFYPWPNTARYCNLF